MKISWFSWQAVEGGQPIGLRENQMKEIIIKKAIFWLSWMGVLALVLLACAPAAPAPSPALAPPVAPAAPALSPEEAAWAQVVAAAKKEGLVNMYAFHFGGDVGRAIARAFEDRYGIRVEILSQSSRPSIERLKVERTLNQQWADLIQGGPSSSTEAYRLGLTESVWRELPELRDKSVFLVDPIFNPEGNIINFVVSFSAPFMNTRLVKPEDEPRSFRNLLDPKWKGRILMGDPRTGAMASRNLFFVYRYLGALDVDYLRQLLPQAVLWTGSNAVADKMVARGEYALGVLGGIDTLAPSIAEGAPLKPLAMEEGALVSPYGIQKIRGGPHPNAAKVFLNWIMSKEGQTTYARAASGTAIRKDVPDFLIPGARVSLKKILPYRWEDSERAGKEFAEGVAEQLFFSKK